MKKSVVILASGGGSNAQKILEYFQDHEEVCISLIITNNAQAGVISIAQAYQVETLIIDNDELASDKLLAYIMGHNPSLIVLAGFLRKIPDEWMHIFGKKIINIHPSLLPKYGGKGMYGLKVHQAVKAQGEKESGITIHYVDEHYDEGDIILQARCALDEACEVQDIASQVLILEHYYYPRVIDFLLKN